MKDSTPSSFSHANGHVKDFESSLNDLNQYIEGQMNVYALLNSRLTRLHSDVAADSFSYIPTNPHNTPTAAIHTLSQEGN